ncbi:uncharacterized protein LOC132728930 [Ruditapes philippinarum]|uniref:uncharacterized protein LOC132728930 n=1 Tax=Ruditapes philippinarum TaxID=129788 RepID=UPI00295C05C3|nr:uncharacterized protein LOC132728930 [Ruditapes philippinarum]XP_060570636.1 uncharacterized protein LOC132728930 [Ruditapes philippinarum]XP_060570637.1 uncharacterized protein LOC132728930 [Ruditapes philippinarum]XP_060570638.1 uncharacterized protein LOC132728930 [Ruditapes philippinarum]
MNKRPKLDLMFDKLFEELPTFVKDASKDPNSYITQNGSFKYDDLVNQKFMKQKRKDTSDLLSYKDTKEQSENLTNSDLMVKDLPGLLISTENDLKLSSGRNNNHSKTFNKPCDQTPQYISASVLHYHDEQSDISHANCEDKSVEGNDKQLEKNVKNHQSLSCNSHLDTFNTYTPENGHCNHNLNLAAALDNSHSNHVINLSATSDDNLSDINAAVNQLMEQSNQHKHTPESNVMFPWQQWPVNQSSSLLLEKGQQLPNQDQLDLKPSTRKSSTSSLENKRQGVNLEEKKLADYKQGRDVNLEMSKQNHKFALDDIKQKEDPKPICQIIAEKCDINKSSNDRLDLQPSSRRSRICSDESRNKKKLRDVSFDKDTMRCNDECRKEGQSSTDCVSTCITCINDCPNNKLQNDCTVAVQKIGRRKQGVIRYSQPIEKVGIIEKCDNSNKTKTSNPIKSLKDNLINSTNHVSNYHSKDKVFSTFLDISKTAVCPNNNHEKQGTSLCNKLNCSMSKTKNDCNAPCLLDQNLNGINQSCENTCNDGNSPAINCFLKGTKRKRYTSLSDELTGKAKKVIKESHSCSNRKESHKISQVKKGKKQKHSTVKRETMKHKGFAFSEHKFIHKIHKRIAKSSDLMPNEMNVDVDGETIDTDSITELENIIPLAVVINKHTRKARVRQEKQKGALHRHVTKDAIWTTVNLKY